jgi:hypothetical protein
LWPLWSSRTILTMIEIMEARNQEPPAEPSLRDTVDTVGI